ncbi:MAG: hypothetical protein PVH91_00805 [Pseudomonadales bacterium]
MSDSITNAVAGAIAIGREIESLASERSSSARYPATGSPLAVAVMFFAGIVALSRAVEKHTTARIAEPEPELTQTSDEGWLR